jgi:replicative DNA helicase
VVDYLQLMSSSTRMENRQVEVATASSGLKVLARELGVAVVALSQLSRALESRSDKRPMLSDLRESGSLEQDADAVIALFRDDFYNEFSETPGETELLLLKNRSGPTGVAKARWLAPFTALEPFALPAGPAALDPGPTEPEVT